MSLKPHIYKHKQINIRRLLSLAIVLVASIIIVNYVIDYRYDQEQKKNVSDYGSRAKSIDYGVALGGYLDGQTQTERIKILRHIKQLGFSEVRFNIDWDFAQRKSPDYYDWSKSDAILGATRDSGLKMIVILDRTPQWARLSSCDTSVYCPPRDPARFAKFSQAAASRYKDYGIRAWEIWNEPNIIEFWKPAPNVAQYAQLLSSASKGIKSSSPGSVVLVGGLAGNAVDTNGSGYIDPRSYLKQLYAAKVSNSFDGVAYHPYTGPRLPSTYNQYNGWYKLANGDQSIRSIMIKNHEANKKVWLTEYGLATGGSGQTVTNLNDVNQTSDHTTENIQAIIVRNALESLTDYPWVHNFDWYTYKDDVTYRTYSGAAYGFLRNDGTAKPVLKELQSAANMHEVKR